MKILQNIIGMMNKEEVRHLKLFMGRTNSGSDRKDADLFDFIRKYYPEYDEEKIQKRLYGSKDKNALYRLKNRLLDDLGKSLSLQYYDDNDFNLVVNSLVLSRLFQAKTQPRIALHYLAKAEKKAQESDALDLLDIIYSEFIRLSQETLELNPTEYIRRRKANREQLNRLQEIDDILAEVIFKVRTTQNFSGQDYRIIETLQQKVNEFSRRREARNSVQLRFKIYQSVSRILLQKHDYPLLEKYLQQTYSDFTRQALFSRNNHDTKLQMLTYLANATFKNNKHDLSLDYAASLKESMGEFGGMLHDKYLFFYYNTLVINYSRKDLNRAIEILNEAKDSPVIKKLPFYTVFIYANLAVANFDNRNYKQAIRNLVKLMMEPGYPNLDRTLRLRLGVAELIIRYELGDFDILEHRIDQVRKEFADLLKTKSGKRHQDMIGIIAEMVTTASVKKEKKLMQKIDRLVSSANSEQANESDIINYNVWLTAKTA
ncbi:MAG: hypothetical protein FD123_304 [Bacteroidetes bacterium]|nr:MAG: hypothetical protein FD123_304 [Bacteroidota bacterium]